MLNYEDKKNNTKFMVVELAPTNYYNNEQNIVRIRIRGENDSFKYYDMYLIQSIDHPNPADHYALICSFENSLNGINDAMLDNDPRLELPPGYKDESTLEPQITYGYVWLVNKRIKKNTTNYNDTSAGMFNAKANNPGTSENVKYSLSPSLKKDYTTTKDKYKGDLNNENIGVFVTDNSVMLKAKDSSIVLGPEGISFLGNKFESNTKGGRAMMQDNPFNGWFPSTIMTIPLGIEYIPNLNFILGIGTACKTLNTGMAAIKKTTKNVKNIIGRK